MSVWPGWSPLGGPKRLDAEERVGLVGSKGARDTWMEHLGCVKLDSQRAYIRQQLFTGCVRAAHPSNIRSMLKRLGNPMGVHIIASSGAVTVDFRLRGELVCCAPWHMEFGSKRENAARGGESRKRRGKHKSRQLVTDDIKVALGRPAPG